MNKNGFIRAYAKRRGCTITEARVDVDAFLAEISEQLAAGGKVKLTGFGSFAPNLRAATVKKPFGGREVYLPARWGVKFLPGADLREAVNTRPVDNGGQVAA